MKKSHNIYFLRLLKAGVPTAYPLYSQRVATVDSSTGFDLADVYAGSFPDASLKGLMSKSQQKILLEIKW